jgi:hypothetical protein
MPLVKCRGCNIKVWHKFKFYRKFIRTWVQHYTSLLSLHGVIPESRGKKSKNGRGAKAILQSDNIFRYTLNNSAKTTSVICNLHVDSTSLPK